jgi:anti-sigma-K factor RskA
MIPEEQQDLAALYVLGSLDANETAEFEAAMRKDAKLRALVNDLHESAVAIAFTAPQRQPPPKLKQHVLRDIAREKSREASSLKKSSSWLPWAIAAGLMIFAGFLAYDRTQIRRELEQARNADPLAGAKFVALAPANGAPAGARAVVAWEPDRQTGVIRISGLPAAGSGKDYQLWAVDEDHKDPISAGIVHVDANGVASVRFKPVVEAHRVKAFAISLEREGGAPKAEGPLLLVGSSS